MNSQASHYAAVSRSLLRVPTYLLLCMYLMVGFLAALSFQISTISLWTASKGLVGGFLVIALWYMNGTALNDYADYEIDLINLKGDKDRPLVSGQVQKNELRMLATSYSVAALGIALVISFPHAVLTAILLMLNYTYSIKPFQISRRGGLGPLLLPLGYVVFPFLFGWFLLDLHVIHIGYMLILALYLQFLGRIILKDYRDVKGDAVHGKRTFLLRHGNKAVCVVSASSILFSALILVTSLQLGVMLFPVVVLTSYSLTMLFQLSQVNVWKKQKPILAAFGRGMTGVTSALIIYLVGEHWRFTAAQMALLTFGVTLVYLTSAQQAFAYNTKRLSTKKSHK